MPQVLDNSTPMQQGAQYSFTFSQSGVPFIAADSNEIVQAVVASLPQISQVAVSGESIIGATIDLTFTYNDPDNNDRVGDMGQYIAQVISTQFILDSFTFVQGFGGPKGSQGDPFALSNGIESTFENLGSTAMYIGIAIVLVVVAIKFL
jgi:hypothetical protein